MFLFFIYFLYTRSEGSTVDNPLASNKQLKPQNIKNSTIQQNHKYCYQDKHNLYTNYAGANKYTQYTHNIHTSCKVALYDTYFISTTI